MVTQAVAKKHKEDAERAKYLGDLGHTPAYIGNPIPPITAEHVFAPHSTPPPVGADDDMDIDDTTPTLDELLLPPSNTNFDYLPPRHHPIPEDDFQPDINLDEDLSPPEPYNEDLENLALEEELSNFANIRYGWLPMLNLPYIEGLIVCHRWEYP